MRIERVTSADDVTADLAEVLVDAVDSGASVGFLAPLAHDEARAYWRSALAAEGALTWVARDGERVVGVVQLLLALKPNAPHRAEVAKLLVHRDARGRGVARRLVEAVEDEARARGRWLLLLDTQTGSSAEDLYARWGWHRTGVVDGYALWPDGRLGGSTFFVKRLHDVPRSGVLVVVGDLVEDVVVWASGAVERGTDTAARVFRSRGGSAGNVAAAAAALVPTRFAGCVGQDRLGDALLDDLSRRGVDVRVQRRGRTGSVVVLVDPDGERTFLPDRAAAADLEPDLSVLDGAAVLHVPVYGLQGARTPQAVRALVADAHRRGVEVSVDASSVAVLREVGVDAVRALQPSVLFANADEAALLGDPPAGTTLVVKDGARPTTVVRADGSTLSVPVPPVEDVRDSTGAGDAFAAGWLSARMEGLDDRACADRAHALARRVLAHPGAGEARTEEHP